MGLWNKTTHSSSIWVWARWIIIARFAAGEGGSFNTYYVALPHPLSPSCIGGFPPSLVGDCQTPVGKQWPSTTAVDGTYFTDIFLGSVVLIISVVYHRSNSEKKKFV